MYLATSQLGGQHGLWDAIREQLGDCVGVYVEGIWRAGVAGGWVYMLLQRHVHTTCNVGQCYARAAHGKPLEQLTER